MIGDWQDFINGSFEILAGFAVLDHIRILYRDKCVNGVSIKAIVFFMLWGCWNLYYYPHLDQWLSFIGGAILVAVNIVYVGMLCYYTFKQRR